MLMPMAQSMLNADKHDSDSRIVHPKKDEPCHDRKLLVAQFYLALPLKKKISHSHVNLIEPLNDVYSFL